MINKNNSVECHASYHEALLKFFAAFRMTTEHQTTSAANQFFAGDASAPQKKEMQLLKGLLPQNLL
ncbi:hypothetical protein LC607_24090 [Nostoc sp. CHAB 5824]|nr:hypothetical protein [Nostoc sp. CHAB 5824]